MSRIIGSKYETIALNHLIENGLTLYKKNYLTPYGEIDLIMQDGDTIIFVEVKMRQSMENALESITPDKREKIMRSIGMFTFQEQLRMTFCRVDVVTIDANQNIEWIKNIDLHEDINI